ncbi:MAG TPA: ATP-binding protein [Gemmatimonadaceae bacterium]|nr:ATP-binding protein [Gemmatimonadaceae bacterium]
MIDIEELRRVEIFRDLSDDDLTWIAERCEEIVLEAGDVFIHAGDKAEWMYIGLEGAWQIKRDNAPSDAMAYTFYAGDVSGLIPFSRMTTIPGTGRALVASRVARFPSALFDALLRKIPVLEPRMVALLTDRVREFTRREQEYERFLALGKMSAGLAHELNNPVAAAQRSASELKRRLKIMRKSIPELVESGGTAKDFRALNAVRQMAAERPAPGGDPLERSAREEALAEWLTACGAYEPWFNAGSFAAVGITVDELATATTTLAPEACRAALSWLAAHVAADALVQEVSQATARIADLLAAIKSYTQMDRPSDREEISVATAIDTVLALFGERFTQKRVTVHREYAPDLPLVLVHVSEINRLWAALLSNALDAVPTGGSITVRACRQPGAVLAEVCDNGPGVPVDIRDRIWEPFFTTKDVGQGAGLGLDIARRIVSRHGGNIELHQMPGETVFAVRLPASAPVPAVVAAP